MRKPLKTSKSTVQDDQLQRGMTALESGQPAEAETIARELLSKNARHAQALHLLGLTLIAQKRAREAVAPLEQAAEERADPTVETHLAMALRETGRTAEALIWLQRAAECEPTSAFACQQLGHLLRSMSRFVEAEAAIKRGLEVAPSSADLSALLGGVLLDRGDAANAKVAFARALANAPGHLGAMHGIGIALQYEGDFERAAEKFKQLLARDPGQVRAHLNLGYCLIEAGRPEEGIASLRAGVKAAPELYGNALKMLVGAGHGKFWLKRSEAARVLRADQSA